MTGTNKKIAGIIFVFTGVLILLTFTSGWMVRFLSKTKKVDANLLVVEGWLPRVAVEEAYNEFINNGYDLIITTGLITSNLDFFNLYMNGYLIFYPKSLPGNEPEKKSHLIEVVAHSKSGGKYRAHFNLYINDYLAADFTADEKAKKYRLTWEGSIKEIDSITVHFDNDYVDEKGDINLYVKEIIIDDKIIIPYKFHSVYDMGILDGKNRGKNNYLSNSDITRNFLIDKGLDPSSVISVTGERTWINRTLSSVTAFRDWKSKYDKNVTGINIVSLGTHSRRTWMTYRKILDRSENIGVISIHDKQDSLNRIDDFLNAIKESLDLIYYWIILIPY